MKKNIPNYLFTLYFVFLAFMVIFSGIFFTQIYFNTFFISPVYSFMLMIISIASFKITSTIIYEYRKIK